MVTLHLVTTHLPTMQISIPYTTLFRSEIAKNLPSVLFVTTTNFIDAIDDAFLSRADLVMHFALPNAETIEIGRAHSELQSRREIVCCLLLEKKISSLQTTNVNRCGRSR